MLNVKSRRKNRDPTYTYQPVTYRPEGRLNLVKVTVPILSRNPTSGHVQRDHYKESL